MYCNSAFSGLFFLSHMLHDVIFLNFMYGITSFYELFFVSTMFLKKLFTNAFITTCKVSLFFVSIMFFVYASRCFLPKYHVWDHVFP